MDSDRVRYSYLGAEPMTSSLKQRLDKALKCEPCQRGDHKHCRGRDGGSCRCTCVRLRHEGDRPLVTERLDEYGRPLKTMTFSDFQRLSFANSPKLPEYVNIKGKRKHWVGIGWVDCVEPPTSDDTVIVD